MGQHVVWGVDRSSGQQVPALVSFGIGGLFETVGGVVVREWRFQPLLPTSWIKSIEEPIASIWNGIAYLCRSRQKRIAHTEKSGEATIQFSYVVGSWILRI